MGVPLAAYNPEVSSEVTNVFATAAFRFSHSMVADTLNFNNQRFNDVESVRFSTVSERVKVPVRRSRSAL